MIDDCTQQSNMIAFKITIKRWLFNWEIVEFPARHVWISFVDTSYTWRRTHLYVYINCCFLDLWKNLCKHHRSSLSSEWNSFTTAPYGSPKRGTNQSKRTEPPPRIVVRVSGHGYTFTWPHFFALSIPPLHETSAKWIWWICPRMGYTQDTRDITFDTW